MSSVQGMSFFSSLFILVFCTNFKPGRPGRILVPGPPLGSRWRLVNKVATELSRAGHDVTMLVPEGTEDNIRDIENFSLLLTSHPEAVRYYKERLNKRVSLAPNAVRFLPEDVYSALSYVADHVKLYELLASECEATFQQGLLNGSRFDLVLSDFLSPCAVILARHLHVPVVSVARGTPGGYDLWAAGVPTPPAYVPQLGLALTDGMSFVQRLENFVVQLVTSALTGSLLLRPFDDIARKRTGVSIRDLLAGTDLWLRHTDPMYETPRPRMPNMVYIGGISASPAEPLTQELEEALARVRGENIAVVTFGSMVDQFDAHLAEVLSTALSRLPYKVVWRHRGPAPRNLGNNTVLLPWLPQNDLLGDPRTRLFVTHGGASGVQEALFHGVPLVGVPLFRDQFTNMARVEFLGNGKAVPLGGLTADMLYRALQDVSSNQTFTNNARRLSRLYRGQPEPPMQRAVWWISHVMRHGGVPHIRSQATQLPAYQYLMIDILLFLLLSIGIVLWCVRKLWKFIRILLTNAKYPLLWVHSVIRCFTQDICQESKFY